MFVSPSRTKSCEGISPTTQWAAVTIQSLLIKVPPHGGILLQLRHLLIPACQGHSPGWARIPPTIREPIVDEWPQLRLPAKNVQLVQSKTYSTKNLCRVFCTVVQIPSYKTKLTSCWICCYGCSWLLSSLLCWFRCWFRCSFWSWLRNLNKNMAWVRCLHSFAISIEYLRQTENPFNTKTYLVSGHKHRMIFCN